MSRIVQSPGSSIVYLELNGEWFYFDYHSQPLGVGAMGTVFLGYHYYTSNKVAIKALNDEFSSNQSIRHRAREEANMSFLHPNILRIYGVCEYAPTYGPIYIVTEYVQGLTIDKYCREYFSICSERERVISILQLSVNILNSLDYLHRVGVVHRDIKPSNIMVTYDGVPKVMDLGIAKFENNVGKDTHGGFIGTTMYAAPELINAEAVDNRADIYAMAITIYELLTGINPFDADSQSEIMMNQLEMVLPANTSIPRRLHKILSKASYKDKNYRYFSAAEFAKDIESFINTYA